jgi:hypothetical protein
MTNAEIIDTVHNIMRLLRQPGRHVFMAVANGLIGGLEDAGVTEADLDRLGF